MFYDLWRHCALITLINHRSYSNLYVLQLTLIIKIQQFLSNFYHIKQTVVEVHLLFYISLFLSTHSLQILKNLLFCFYLLWHLTLFQYTSCFCHIPVLKILYWFKLGLWFRYHLNQIIKKHLLTVSNLKQVSFPSKLIVEGFWFIF